MDDNDQVGASRTHRIEGAASLALDTAMPFDAHGKPGFLLHLASGFVAYRNACPHWGVTLDMDMGGFYDAKTERVFCRTHGALFVVPSGECVRGPCLGDSLDQWTCAVDGDDVVVDVPTPGSGW